MLDPPSISDDGHPLFRRRNVQHDGVLWGSLLLPGYHLSEQSEQILRVQRQRERMGLDTRIIDQVIDDTLLKLSTLRGSR
ncbi:hypothetical protein KSD_41900 [Ktedonobacter sp. SOSP1-85]|uniref:hypothetical protein n=1 Tax=Ktedonobacter sp. SOSP1-85 TaxID=2778367 RepID=UPI001A2B8619|nr:hypothetical protein [Ktedonobacter sp. SOSP1-85]GHO76419.1 hypothetical protein KSD_41900 [Ktedonobacter sp. SOSP1-85]